METRSPFPVEITADKLEGTARQLHAVFPSRRGLVPAVRAFIEFLAMALSLSLSQTMQQENQALQELLAGACGMQDAVAGKYRSFWDQSADVCWPYDLPPALPGNSAGGFLRVCEGTPPRPGDQFSAMKV